MGFSMGLEVPVMVTLVGIDLRRAQILGPSHETAPGFKPCWDAQEGIGYQFPRLLSFCRRRQSTYLIVDMLLTQTRAPPKKQIHLSDITTLSTDVKEPPAVSYRGLDAGTLARSSALVRVHSQPVSAFMHLVRFVTTLDGLMMSGAESQKVTDVPVRSRFPTQ